jgi:FdhD protein
MIDLPPTKRVVRADGHRDWIAVEEPLQIQLKTESGLQELAVLMRTPGQDQQLVAGFLFSEGLIDATEDLISLEASGHPSDSQITVEVRNAKLLSPRRFVSSSSCGVCGRSSIEALLRDLPIIPPFSPTPEQLIGFFARLQQQQPLFAQTGGVHAAAVFDWQENLLQVAEDVGRHNAVDKLVGALFLQANLPVEQTCLVVSSRSSFDIVQKAARAGISSVATVGAPSSLAIELAKAAGISLFGFVRDGRSNRYC